MIAVQLWIWQIQERTLIVSCPQDLPQCQVERSANIARISLAGWYWHWLWWPQLFLSCNCCVTCRRWRCSSDYNVYLAPHYLRSGPCQPLPGHPRTSTLWRRYKENNCAHWLTDWLTDWPNTNILQFGAHPHSQEERRRRSDQAVRGGRQKSVPTAPSWYRLDQSLTFLSGRQSFEMWAVIFHNEQQVVSATNFRPHQAQAWLVQDDKFLR